MDWSNESYVRLYTRDTTSWKRLGWDGQCVLMALLRKVDRAGTLDLGGLEPWEAIALHTGAPEDVARRGITALLRVESVTICDDRITLPNFLVAQECSKSDKLRAKESRQRRALGLTEPSKASQIVTAPSQDVTEPSRPVTARHEQSHAVTSCHSLLCSADPLLCSAEEETSSLRSEVVAPAGAKPSGETKRRKARSKPEALAALESALEAQCKPCPPVLTQSLGAKASKRVQALVDGGHANTLTEAASSLVAAWREHGTGNAWKLLDVDPVAAPRGLPANGRLPRTRGTTHLDFADEPTVEEQLRGWANG